MSIAIIKPYIEEQLEEKKSNNESIQEKKDFIDRIKENGKKAWEGLEVKFEKMDQVLSQFATEIKRVLDSIMNEIPFPSHQNKSQYIQHKQNEEKKEEKDNNDKSNCSTPRICIPVSRPVIAEAVVNPSPQRERMEGNNNLVFLYGNELEMISSMGLIRNSIDKETVKELLIGSKGNIDQTVQWMIEKLKMVE